MLQQLLKISEVVSQVSSQHACKFEYFSLHSSYKYILPYEYLGPDFFNSSYFMKTSISQDD